MKNFNEFHCHPQSLDSGSTPKAIIDREIELKTGSITCTDHGSMAACRKVYDLAKAAKITPILGCLLSGQEIHTIDGVKKVEDVAVGDLVLTHKGRFKKVVSTSQRDYNGSVYTVFQARNGDRGLTLTGEHPILIADNKGNIKWVKAEELVGGLVGKIKGLRKYKSYVLMPYLKGSDTSITTIDYLKTRDRFNVYSNKVERKFETTNNITVWNGFGNSIPIDEDFAYFLGLFTAEGCAQSSGVCSITFNINEDEYIDFCVSFLYQRFGVTAQSYYITQKGVCEIIFCNVPLSYILGGMVGVGARNKKIPREIMLSAPNVRRCYLRGLLDGDAKKDNNSFLKTASKNLTWSARLLLLDSETMATPKLITSSLNGKEFEHWSINITKLAKWRRTLDINGEFRASPVREVKESHYTGRVYNFEVEDDHSYVSDFILHNCEGYFFDPEDEVLKSFGITDIKGYVGNYYHITLHYLDQQAYEAGCRILSEADRRAIVAYGERKPPFTWKDLEELCSYNVTIGTGCFGGMVPFHVQKHGRVDIAQAYYSKLRSICKPGNFYVELFPHCLTHDWVAGCYLTFNDNSTLKLPPWKTIKVDGEKYKVSDFAKLCGRKKGPHGTLEAVMENRVFVLCEPKVIAQVEEKEGFVQNECTPTTPGGDLQYPCNRVMHILAEKNKDPIVISGDAHFDVAKSKIVQDIRLSSNGAPWKFYASYHRQSSEEAFEHFSKHMGISQAKFEEWIENNANWASRFKDFKFIDRKQLPTHFYPSDTLEHLHKLIDTHGRMDWENPVWVERLKSEIELFQCNGVLDFLPYFFVAEEGVRQYEELEQLTGVGRGSGAGLLLTYILNITHVDPIKFKLSKDRFLTIDRIKTGKFPDIDQDLPDVSVLTDPETGWLEKRFKGHYAQISTETTLKLKSTVKDVARALLGSVPYEIEKLAKDFQVPPQGMSDKDFVFGYKKDEEWVLGSLETDPKLQEYVSKYPEQWEIVQQCLGLVRNKGRHASAYCIVDEPISNFIPLTEVGGVRVTQYDMRSVEAVGGVKMDYLGLNTLRDLGLAIKLIQQQRNIQLEKRVVIDGKPVPRCRVVPFEGKMYDIWDLPISKEVCNMICEGDTETIFQFGTPTAKKWLKYFDYHKPNSDWKLLDSIEALSAFTALDRPGPLDYLVEGKHNMLIEYSYRARGKAPVGNLPILDEMFPETYGILTFQEQLTKAFREIGGSTGVQAENFREHVGKKKLKLIFEDKKIFMPGASEKLGVEVAEELFKSLETFGKYGFNCAHSTSYAITGYATAFLKYYYPVEWWCSVLEHADKTKINEKFWKYCSHLVLLPDINKSGDGFQIEGDKIRAPLWLLHGVADTSHKELCEGKPYKDIDDFCQKIQATKTTKGRSSLNKTIVCNFIVTGAMDSLFFPGASIDEKIEQYRLATGRAGGDKRLKIDPIYTNINQYQRYQVIKQVLPMYAASILPMMLERGEPGIEKSEHKHIRAMYCNEFRGTVKKLPMVDMENLHLALERDQWLGDTITVAAAAYVVEERRFSFTKDGLKKDAIDLALEIDGIRYNYVKWSDKTGKLPKYFEQELAGAIAIVVLEKYNPTKPFSILDLVIVQPPLKKEKTK